MKLKEFFALKPALIGTFPSYEHLPASSEPEVAFVGRSNVGKSSLINALFNSYALARVSNTPGRTQTINMFSLAGRLMIADLPGYGFANAPKDIADAWNENMRAYLKTREQLKRVFVLVDSRIGLKLLDVEMMYMMDKIGLSYQAVLTKTDKISLSELSAVRAELDTAQRQHPAMHPIVLNTSTENGAGLDEVRGSIFDLIK
ncbi:MAG: ribosome biogenesis GTP-binding protein YihA/YsxC [Rickettsiales bacterium]|jgi:GTP-binding protein|nr:ribosome biogenesis GTP-binding protein YihA/YsxC [Rickettsiales bacterium]